MTDRPKHKKREIEALLQKAEDQKWRVWKDKGYFKAYCPCSDKHKVSVSLTPSASNALLNIRGDFRRASCWQEDS